MEKEVNNNKKLNFFALLILIVVIGFLAGISGEIFTRYYLANLAFFRDLYFTESSDFGQKEIVIRDAKKVVVEQDLRVEQIKNDVQNKLIGVFRQPQASANLLDKVMLAEDYIGQAAILTSDGWLVTTDEVLILPKESLVINYNDKLYDLEKVVTDKATGLVFLKIDVQNLPVVKLADANTITAGQNALVYNSFSGELILTTIKNQRYKTVNSKYDLVSYSQNLDKSILLSQEFADQNRGCALLNLQGEIIGFLSGLESGLNQAVPINYLTPIINQVLKDEEISRAYLGVNYLDLSQVIGLSPEERQKSETGALLWSDKNGLVISKDSPLAGKLVKGDIILSFEGQKIDKNNDLVDLLLQYKTGQQINLRYLHDNKENELNITLK